MAEEETSHCLRGRLGIRTAQVAFSMLEAPQLESAKFPTVVEGLAELGDWLLSMAIGGGTVRRGKSEVPH